MRLWGLMLFALAASQPAWAKMYKWVDEQGKTHYGDTIPAQYAGQGNAELNKRGMVIKQTDPALTEEQRKEKEEAAARQKAEAQKALEAERRDRALINTFTNEKEIDLARNRNLQAADAVIQSTQARIKTVQAKLDGLRQHAGTFIAAKKPVPAYVSDDMQATEAELQRLHETVAQKQKEQDAIRAKFEADKQRFRELKGNAASAAASPVGSATPQPAMTPAKK